MTDAVPKLLFEIAVLRNFDRHRVRIARFGNQRDGFDAKRKAGVIHLALTTLVHVFRCTSQLGLFFVV